jgi:outer membrane protein TolC
MRAFNLGIAIALLLAPARPCRSEDRPAQVLRLADVLEQVRERNPALAAARARADGARFAPVRVSAYDDPTLSWEAWNAPESFRIDQADNNIFKLSQKLPFPGKRTLAGRIAEREAEIAGAEAGTSDLALRAAVKHAYYALWQAHQNLRIYSRDEDLAARLARVSEQKYAIGQISQPDVLRSQVELTRLVNRVATESLAIDGARAELNALLSRAPGEPLGVPEDPPVPRLVETDEELVARALRTRPEVVELAAALERERSKVEMARLDYLPDFELSVSRFVNHHSRDGFGAMAAISVPLVHKSKYDAQVGEARAGVAIAEAERRLIADRIAREVRQAFLRARTALLQRELLSTTHVPQAEQAFAASEIAYRTGKIDFLSLIDSLRAVEAVHLEHAAAEAGFEEAFADLERAVGEVLERGESQ